MATFNYKLGNGFIHGNETLNFAVHYFAKGDVVTVAAYPTDGVPGVELKVENLRFRKFVDNNFNWLWIASYDIINLSGQDVVFEVYLGITSI